MILQPKEPLTLQLPEDQVDNKLELLKHASSVHSRGIQKDITSDYLFAKLEDDKSDAISELIEQAFFSRRAMNRAKNKAKTYTWNHQQKEWHISKLTPIQQHKMETASQTCFDGFVTAPNMQVVLKRNKPRNPMLKLLAGFDDEQIEGTPQYNEKEDLLDQAEQKRRGTQK